MVQPKIKKELFIKNRSKLKSLLPANSCCIVFSNDEMPRNGDSYFPYRQNSDFFYLTGIEQEKSVFIMAPDHPDPNMREVLFIIHPDPNIEIWTGYKLKEKEAVELSGITSIQHLENYESFLNNILFHSGIVFLNIPEIPKFKPDIVTRDIRLSNQIKNQYPLHQYERLFPLLRQLRMIKEPEEIEQIQKACDITAKAFEKIIRTTKPGICENEIEAEITYIFNINGAKHAYSPIVGSGKNSCILHYTENSKLCHEGDLVLMDFGAEVNNYAADCTRTIPVNGEYSPRQAEIYDKLHSIFTKMIMLMIPGNTLDQVQKKACQWMEEMHIDLGLYSKEDLKDQNPESPLYFKYYMHGSGHSLGLDVHDVFNKHTAFEPGMVFTCEPGIYIQEEYIGIRIENDILITQNGNIDLMAGIPSKRSDIEELMKKSYG